MPCRTDFQDIQTPKVDKTSYDALKKEADNVTKLLCGVMTFIEEYGTPEDERHLYREMPEVKKWFDSHKEKDIQRREHVKRAALGKLTSEEREALGL